MARQQTNIRLDEGIKAKLRAKAESEGRSLSEVIREFLARGLQAEATKKAD